MRRVGEVCLARDIPCQLALERYMACGMGTCQSCIVRIRHEQPPALSAGPAPDGLPRRSDAKPARGWSYKLCCTDGPVFDAADVLW